MLFTSVWIPIRKICEVETATYMLLISWCLKRGKRVNTLVKIFCTSVLITNTQTRKRYSISIFISLNIPLPKKNSWPKLFGQIWLNFAAIQFIRKEFPQIWRKINLGIYEESFLTSNNMRMNILFMQRETFCRTQGKNLETKFTFSFLSVQLGISKV